MSMYVLLKISIYIAFIECVFSPQVWTAFKLPQLKPGFVTRNYKYLKSNTLIGSWKEKSS